MRRLLSITISGFKSFGKKSVLKIDEEIIAIVGPNGSGKSNVVEAIRFVLGEQSNKGLRIKQSGDLFFQSSDGQKNVKECYVSLVFNNTDRVFSIESEFAKDIKLACDEIVITRRIFSDGVSSYLLNGTEVRLKDILELIAGVNIGSSGYHIISQGQADRLIHSSPSDRQSLLEEALGLKIYQYRLKESVQKINRTRKHLLEIESLRNEISPRLKYLEAEIHKIEKKKELQKKLQDLYSDYFPTLLGLSNKANISFYETNQKYQNLLDNIKSKENSFKEIENINNGLSNAREDLFLIKRTINDLEKKSQELDHQKTIMLAKKDSISSMKKSFQDNIISSKKANTEQVFSEYADISGQKLADVLSEFHPEKIFVFDKDAYSLFYKNTADLLIESRIESTKNSHQVDNYKNIISDLEKQMVRLDEELQVITPKIENISAEINNKNKDLVSLQQELDLWQEKLNNSNLQKQEYSMLVQLEDGLSKQLLSEKINLENYKNTYDKEINEASILLGDFLVKDIASKIIPVDNIKKEELDVVVRQKERELEKVKLQLESIGSNIASEEVSEYENIKERNEFLSGQINDLKKAEKNLNSLIRDLKNQLATEFSTGISRINNKFELFFQTMFLGGSAKLIPIEQENELESGTTSVGIDVEVRLPNKPKTSLSMLSGGERSLVSMALLFAITQVNPPPFLVLDETDAALDESNSVRYGELLEKLAKYCQLLVITHNRATMHRAKRLLGVTLQEGGSIVLPMTLEE